VNTTEPAAKPSKFKRVRSGLATAFFALVLLFVAFVLVIGNLPSFASTTATSDGAGDGTIAFDPETDLVLEEARCVSNDFINSSVQSVKTGDVEYRQFATAVSIPFKGATDAEVTKEILAEICGNPTFLKMVADDMMLWTGFPGADDNKAWLEALVSDLNTKGLDSFVVKKTEDGGLVVNEQFQKYAGWINTVLLHFNEEGKQSLTSERNWELPATVDPTTLPIAVQASTVDTKPAWVRTLKDKNGTCLYRIGFNAADKRIEMFPCVTPGTPGTPDTPDTPDNPGCTEPNGCKPPVVKCPPGQVGTPPNCLVPKSSDPKDYEYPTDKPKVTVDGPADTKKPEVKTEQNGGGGVVDTPTNNSGSETGVQAPNTTPAPTTPTNPSTNLGGDNGAGDPDKF